ncbi:MAG: AAA family ATPase, partial [Deltaproteobacteria bacterium]|nr:AAA family ATPase [Deltaproteobacteria bacterium]
MRCTSCGFENPEGLNFCGQCATSLTPRCPQCGFENPPGFQFCGKCAAPLVALVPSGQQARTRAKPATRTTKGNKRSSTKPPEGRRGAPEAERRQLTVMFCDLVGSTALSEQLDPEELRDVVRAYQQTSAAVIDHYEGHIAQHLGDGLLVYFGYPVAHEDDAQRAVRTALGIVEAIQQLSFPTMALPRPLQVRIGVHTGLVVVGEIGSSEKREMLALGETPNIAARLQGLAAPDTVVLSAPTQRLVAGLFECQLIGRAHEMELLRERWEKARQREGQVVLLSGEPGIGKSRLVQEFKDQLAHEGVTRIEFRCSPYYQNTALYPITEHLQRLLQFQSAETPQT